MIHAEVVLKGDGGKGLCGGLDLDMFLGFNSLVQAVAPSASLHDTSGLLVHDFYLPVHDYVFLVDTEHCVSLEQLQNSVHAFALDSIFREEFVLSVQAFLVREALVGFQCRKFGGYVGQNKELVILNLVCEPLVALVGEIYGM